MVCEGGCVNGPAMLYKDRTFMKERNQLINSADERGVLENVARYDDLKVDMTRTFQ